MPAPTQEQREAWKAAQANLELIAAHRKDLLKPTTARYLAAIEAVDLAEEACQPVAHCEGCGEPIFVGDKMLGGDDPLCGECAPTYADLLASPDHFVSFADDEDRPMTAAEAQSIYDAHIAAGGAPGDSMATVVED